MKRILNLTFLLVFTGFHHLAISQAKRPLDHDAYDVWKTIATPAISKNGNLVSYVLKTEASDPTLKVYFPKKDAERTFHRSAKASITWDERFVIFSIHPAVDSLKLLRRQKVKKEKLPKDSLGIFNVTTQQLEKIARVRSFKVPEKWSGWMAYQTEPPLLPDSLQKKLPKRDTMAFDLVIRNLETGHQDTVIAVKQYVFAEEGKTLLLESAGDSTFAQGIYCYEFTKNAPIPIFRAKGKYKALTLDKSGQQGGFMVDLDTTKILIRPWRLFYWQTGQDSCRMIAGHQSGDYPEDWVLSEHGDLRFSEDGSQFFFGTSPKPVLQDTMLLPEEIVKVEVWNWQDQRLFTQQNAELKEDKQRSFTAVYHISQGKTIQLADLQMPQIVMEPERNASVALGLDNQHYMKYTSWEGWPYYQDVYVVDVKTGTRKKVRERLRANLSISPGAQYFYWYSVIDSAWFTYHIGSEQAFQITDNTGVPFYNELHDIPDLPRPYGAAGWTEGDEKLLIYDRYDIWALDPQNRQKPVNLTNGRARRSVHRYIDLDPEAHFISSEHDLLLSMFDEHSKGSGFATINLRKSKAPQVLMQSGRHHYGSPAKALGSKDLIFTQENFQTFPDLWITDLKFKSPKQLSHANPQQSRYRWGSSESVHWHSLDGKPLEGLLIKPEDFDPNKKYPLMVYFYERNANNLHRHIHPYAHRSIINFTFYASRGYVIFVPDIPYRIGYPGESALDAVLPGVTRLVDQGFIDQSRIGVQGHSWGGYQVAYLVTQTDMFKAAEAGAPVSNMISAYGGIRWETGLSRMFQYEHTQSRIGGSLWQYPMRYVENSPIFFADKINTPLLIMHNDHDGHVPWYQGIELFVALRRLGKPTWMINYVGEPHWPSKFQNRKDWAIRMQQYFDHYLMDAPAPKWMVEGMPAIEKGIKQGYELIKTGE